MLPLPLNSPGSISHDASNGPQIVFFSGGTALNAYVSSLSQLSTRATHVLSIADDGGSSGEISRVLGGPAIGDIRSRLIRFADRSTEEAKAVQTLLMHRLPADENSALQEWHAVVTGSHALWKSVSEAYAQTIRAFLSHFHSEILKRGTSFRFALGSVGNFFFTGARLFFASLEAAIFLFSRVAKIPETLQVLPAIRALAGDERRLTLAVDLIDGTRIVGQSAISHPPSTGSLAVDKKCDTKLPSPISRLFYLNEYGQEVLPSAHPSILPSLAEAEAIVYSMGSLYTSIVAGLLPSGIGEAIAANSKARKVLLLNGTHDRETEGMNAVDFVRAITSALNAGLKKKDSPLSSHAFVTHLIYVEGSEVEVKEEELKAMKIEVIRCRAAERVKDGPLAFHNDHLIRLLFSLISGFPLSHQNASASSPELPVFPDQLATVTPSPFSLPFVFSALSPSSTPEKKPHKSSAPFVFSPGSPSVSFSFPDPTTPTSPSKSSAKLSPPASPSQPKQSKNQRKKQQAKGSQTPPTPPTFSFMLPGPQPPTSKPKSEVKRNV